MTAKTDLTATPATATRSGGEEAVLRYYAGLADEMRGPLNALAGWIEVLAQESASESTSDVRHAAAVVIARLRRLCDDAKDSATVALGQVELHRQPVDLSAVVGEVAASTAPARFDAPGPVVVHGDRKRLTQAVTTLLSAPAAYGPVSVTLSRHGAWAHLSVTSARPVPFEVFRGLFEPFSRPPGSGDAVGLYVCRALVAAHGGEVGVNAGDDGGTTLWLRLPVPGEGAAGR